MAPPPIPAPTDSSGSSDSSDTTTDSSSSTSTDQSGTNQYLYSSPNYYPSQSQYFPRYNQSRGYTRHNIQYQPYKNADLYDNNPPVLPPRVIPHFSKQESRPEIPQRPEVPQRLEIPQRQEIPQRFEIPQRPEIPQRLDIPQRQEIPQLSQPELPQPKLPPVVRHQEVPRFQPVLPEQPQPEVPRLNPFMMNSAPQLPVARKPMVMPQPVNPMLVSMMTAASKPQPSGQSQNWTSGLFSGIMDNYFGGQTPSSNGITETAGLQFTSGY